MKRMMMTVLVAATALAAAPAAMAQSPGKCSPGQRECGPRNEQRHERTERSAPPQRANPAPAARHRDPAPVVRKRVAPRPGGIARGARFPKHERDRRLPPPPRGQQYRIYEDRVVRVDAESLRIVAVLGLLNELFN